jgi:ABC-2 type transport system ATP-binding protein
MPIIEVKELTRSFKTQHKEPGLWNSVKGLIHPVYEEVQAVKNISFQIEKGELVGFLGPNGAGKTTTLKMLSGLLYPTSGTAHVLNHIPWERKDSYRRQFSLVMGQKNQLWWDLPAMESLLLNKEVYSVPDAKFKAMVDELVSLLDVAHKLHVPVRELSLGERMKLELIAALLFSPSVIFLDEPTIGLDVISQKKVRDFVRYYNDREKATIILTSHYMSDIEELCERVIIIDHGVLLYDGNLKGILEKFANYKIMTLISESAIKEEDITKYGELVSNLNNKTVFKVKRNMVAQASGDLLNQYQIKDLSIEEVPIEDVVRDIFGNQEKI